MKNNKPENELSAKENFEILRKAAAVFEAKKKCSLRETAKLIIRDSPRNFKRSKYA